MRLVTNSEQELALEQLQVLYLQACNDIVRFASSQRYANNVGLHHICYYAIREKHPALGSQMVCIAIKQVASAYKTLLANRKELKKSDWPEIAFGKSSSVHFDKRTYSLKDSVLSLFTLQGRIKVALKIGAFQKQYLAAGTPKEAQLVHKKKGWFFNLVLELPDTAPVSGNGILGVDLGENNLAATSSGKLFGGGKLCFERDKYLHLRGRLQRNGSKSAKQLLKKVSGKESRHVRHVNHEVSKAIVQEAINNNRSVIMMENLTNIRKRIKASKRMRSRLHRWAWAQLQQFVEYKAQAVGIRVEYINPAYTSQTCASCGNIGKCQKHRFFCPFCGRLAHADLNASLNIASLGVTAVAPTGVVNHPHVAAIC